MTDHPRPAHFGANKVKHAAGSGKQIRGVHLTFPSTTIIEILASENIDFVYLDGEHGGFASRDLDLCCLAAERHGLVAIARIPDIAPSTIGTYLDRGVRGLVVPHVAGLADVHGVIDAAYYAPWGSRSVSAGRPHYGFAGANKVEGLAARNDDLSLCVMIESLSALNVAGEIAALQQVDYISFGLHDLAQTMGFPGQPKHPEVTAAVQRVSDAIRKAGKPIREDFMHFAWISDILIAGTKQLIGESRHADV